MKAKGKMTTREVLDALRRRHGEMAPFPAWVCVEEALSGWSNMLTGGIDLLAMGAWGTAKVPGLERCGERSAGTNYPVVAYEVKVSRADFRRELEKWPRKAQCAIDVSHYFVFATPAGLLDPIEIEQREPWELGGPRLWLPEGVGLVEVDGRGCRATVKAAPTEARALTRAEIHEIIRHATKPLRRSEPAA